MRAVEKGFELSEASNTPVILELRWNAFVFDPAVAAEIGGVWRDENGVRNRSTYDYAERRIDLELEGGATVPLWWVERDEWEAAIAEAGLEVEALYGWFDRGPFDDDEPRVRLRRAQAGMSETALYDRIARIYDPWSASVTEDVEFYVEEARRRPAGRSSSSPSAPGGSPFPSRRRASAVIGVDESPGMLAVAREYAEREGVDAARSISASAIMRAPPVDERVPLVAIPFRSLLHMPDEAREAPARSRLRPRLLEPGGRLVFDVFAPSRDGHRGDRRDLARARAGDLRARRLGRARTARSCSPCGAATRRRRWSSTGSRRPSGTR